MDKFTLRNFYDKFKNKTKALFGENKIGFMSQHQRKIYKITWDITQKIFKIITEEEFPNGIEMKILILSLSIGSCDGYFFANVLNNLDTREKVSLMDELLNNLDLDFCSIKQNNLLESYQINYPYKENFIWLNDRGTNFASIKTKLSNHTFSCDLIDKIASDKERAGRAEREREERDRAERERRKTELLIEENKLIERYERLKNLFYLGELTEYEHKFQVNDFLRDYEEFVYRNPEAKSRYMISRIKSFISDAKDRTEKIKLFNEPYDFSSPIPEINKSYLETRLTDLKLFNKESASSSYIFRGKYNGKLCYIKTFFSDRNLEFEQKIYKYIKERNDKIQGYFSNYFVKVYDLGKITCNLFTEFLDERNVKNEISYVSWREKELRFNKLGREFERRNREHLYFIITEDIGGISFGEYYTKNLSNENMITNMLFEISYGYYLLNYKLKILHNDNHFGNILVKTDMDESECDYIIDNVEYSRRKNFRICIYDFDNSLNKMVSRHEDYVKDVWAFAVQLPVYNRYDIGDFLLDNKCDSEYRVFINNFLQKCDFIEPELVEKSKKKYGYLFEIILNIILGNNERLFTMYCRHFENPDNMRGVNNMYRYPTDPDLDWEKILRRFIYGRRTGHILNISVSNPFYKKYLKYKKKYLEIKG
jgi:hypothetical protein